MQQSYIEEIKQWEGLSTVEGGQTSDFDLYLRNMESVLDTDGGISSKLTHDIRAAAALLITVSLEKKDKNLICFPWLIIIRIIISFDCLSCPLRSHEREQGEIVRNCQEVTWVAE